MLAAVSGARGRVGSALVAALRGSGFDVAEWSRPDFDLDDPSSAQIVTRDLPDIVFHCAAWTDVDGCARNPGLAMRRNGDATADLAGACQSAGSALVYLSTNEVFDGRRGDERPYAEDDPPSPSNAYGASKLAGELAALRLLANGGRAWIARTSWVFGGGNDFPAKIIAAARGLTTGQALRVVTDEIGRPTNSVDLAAALVALPELQPGVYHLANDGRTSRFDWAKAVLDRCVPGTQLEPVSLDDWVRPSTPPRWGVLGSGKAEREGVTLRDWRHALDAYLAELCRS